MTVIIEKIEWTQDEPYDITLNNEYVTRTTDDVQGRKRKKQAKNNGFTSGLVMVNPSVFELRQYWYRIGDNLPTLASKPHPRVMGLIN